MIQHGVHAERILATERFSSWPAWGAPDTLELVNGCRQSLQAKTITLVVYLGIAGAGLDLECELSHEGLENVPDTLTD